MIRRIELLICMRDSLHNTGASACCKKCFLKAVLDGFERPLYCGKQQQQQQNAGHGVILPSLLMLFVP